MRKLALLGCLALCLFISKSAFGGTEGAILEVKSPVDGSVWTATSGEGISRVGRNGKTLHYGISSGSLGSDTVLSLFFDKDNVLWVLDASLRLSTYTSTEGFTAVNEGVTSLGFNFETNQIYFTKRNQKALYTVSEGKIADILFSPSEEFAVQSPSAPQKSHSHGVYFLLAALAFLVGCAITYIIFKASKKSSRAAQIEAPVQQQKKEVVKEEQKEPEVLPVAQDETPAQETKPEVPKVEEEPREFTKLVLNLVKEHLHEPDFGVEAIAEITGISRIHVNRKLKAEGAPAPSVMLKKERMEKAQELLRSGLYSIAEISKLCGFRTPAYFATAFKEYFGCPPSDFLAK